MAHPAIALDSRQGQLDSLLEQICIALQITPTQYADAKQKYEAVGEWLSADGSLLQVFHPMIYPQGSMRLGTTNRPWVGEEFDLDLVCQLHGCSGADPLVVYDLVFGRLNEHGTYTEILEKKKRCLRLNYAGNFHLDILPACPDPRRGGACVKVPDRKLECWMPTNPIGFASWFFDRCRYQPHRALGYLAKDVRPLPSPVPSEMKYPLQRTVQLLKRHRDSFFNGNPEAARSVVLTTLAATFYRGQESLTVCLDDTVSAILRLVESTPGIIAIPNPTNPDENFADSWTEETYSQFKRYIRHFRQQLDALLAKRGLDDVSKGLGSLFGSSIATKAVSAFGGLTRGLRDRGELLVAPKTATITTAVSGLAIPRNNFFGKA
ncbi:MAG: nucleotidyltransferase [Acidobacteriales bacterium]|nr:nucleotidyltransferase [Terriglobales bacterium]